MNTKNHYGLVLFPKPEWEDTREFYIVDGLVHPDGTPVVEADFPLTNIETILMRHQLEGIPVPYRNPEKPWPNGELAFWTEPVTEDIPIKQRNGYDWYWGENGYMMIVSPPNPDIPHAATFGDKGTFHGIPDSPTPSERTAAARELYVRWGYWPYGYSPSDPDRDWAEERTNG